MRKSRDEALGLFKIKKARSEIQLVLPSIFPGALAPVIIRGDGGERELTEMRWGFPPPPNVGTRPITNVRNVSSSFWKPWLKPEFRCLVLATSFCEWSETSPKTQHWFALNSNRPPFAFAGIWRPWTGTRKGETKEHHLFAFLTTEPNEVVRPIHSKAMPVMLCDEEEWEQWLSGSVEDALKLQLPLKADRLSVVLKGTKTDEGGFTA